MYRQINLTATFLFNSSSDLEINAHGYFSLQFVREKNF